MKLILGVATLGLLIASPALAQERAPPVEKPAPTRQLELGDPLPAPERRSDERAALPEEAPKAPREYKRRPSPESSEVKEGIGVVLIVVGLPTAIGGVAWILDQRRREVGSLATPLPFVAGVGMLAGGITLLVLGARELAPSSGSMRAAPTVTVGWTGRGVAIVGAF